MREIADLLGIPPAASSPDISGGVDETGVEIDAQELEEMSARADAALQAILKLQVKSTNFESEISQLSSTMAVLKTRSKTLHHQLLTRDLALATLDPLLSQLVPTSADVGLIFEGEIGPAWYEALDRIRAPLPSAEKMGIAALEAEPGSQTGNHNSATPKLLDSARRLRKVLISRALERAKMLFVAKLRMLRRPGMNAQVVQQDVLNAAPALRLLMAQTPRLANSLGRAYRNTMKWYYTMLLGKYGRWLGRQPLASAEYPKLLGGAVTKSAALFAGMGNTNAHSVDAFSVGARPTVLGAADIKTGGDFSSDSFGVLPMTAVPPAAAPHYFGEVLVSSLLATLADSVDMEVSIAPLIAVTSPILEMFEPVLAAYGTLLNSWIHQCRGDVFGLLLMVRLAEESSLNQTCPEWLQTNIVDRCWPLITSICHEQAQSIESAALKASNQKSAGQKGPHMLTQLVSSFFSGILQLCHKEPEAELQQALQEIVQAYELFISKLAGGNESVLHTNYFVMAALLGDIPGNLAEAISRHFQMLVDAHAAK